MWDCPVSSSPYFYHHTYQPCAALPMARSLLSLAVLLLLVLSASAHVGHDDDDDEDESPTKPDLRSKSLILVKIWCLILEFIVTFVSGISPFFMKWNQGFLVLGTQSAGGVFLGTALMHFLSDSAETFEDLTSKDYPFAYMLSCAGYLVTMLADCVISHVYGKRKVVGDYGVNQSDKNNINGRASQFQVVDEEAPGAKSLGDCVMLIVALCFHSVFEGIAIGVAETTGDAWKALWTITLHKVFAAIAMGIALLRMIPDRPLLSCAAYAFLFAVSTPVGVAIGIVIDATTQGVVADWIYAISMGLACGVFVYVSINHLLSKGYSPPTPLPINTPHARFLAVLLGVGVIAVVMIWDT